jgi:type I restriction enzyme S subunit
MSEVTSNFPQLRFPDFDDKWEEKRLSDIAEKSNVKNRDNEVSSVFTNSATKGVVNQRDFFDKDIANQNNLDGYYIINHDNFVYNPRISFSAPVGPLNRNHLGTGVMSPLYTILKINNVSLDFIERYFKTTKWHRYMNNIANIGARHDRMNIISSDFMKMPIPLPKDEEQQKIAASLAAVDNKIEQLSKKQALLSEYKKGLMQQIFSQAIRFQADDGCDFPDWEEKKLGDLFSGIKGRGLSKGDITIDGLNKCILYGELYTTYPEVIKNIVSRTNSDDGVKSQAGDLLVPCSTTTTGIDLADVTAINEDNVLLGGDMSILRLKKDGDSIFFAYYLTHYKKFDLAKYGQGSTIVHLYYSHFKKIDLKFPSSVEEQTKIANFLSSIDNKIEQVGKQLDESKQFKKALLQQMFV